MGKYEALFDDYKLSNYGPSVEDTAGPVTPQSMADTRTAKIREVQDAAGMLGDQDTSKQTYENVRAGLAKPANRDLTMDDIVAPDVQADDISHNEGHEFLKFAGAGAAGELIAPLAGRAFATVADKARAIRAARIAARPPQVIADPAALRPVEIGPPKPDFWTPRDGDQGASFFEIPSTAERTINLRPAMAGRLNAEGSKGGAVAEAAKLEQAAARGHSTEIMDASDVYPPHEHFNQEKVNRLAESMQTDGWRGEPILTIGNKTALTGTHRLAAADASGTPVPVHSWNITPKEKNFLKDSGVMSDDYRIFDQEDFLAALERMRKDGILSDPGALRIYKAEAP